MNQHTHASKSEQEKRAKSKRKRHGSRNQHKTKTFVKWLLNTFPQLHFDQTDSERPMVLDVAGGKGELAVRLSLCHQLRVVMVDPREADPVKCFLGLVLPKLPHKWQQRFENRQAEYLEEHRKSGGISSPSPSYLDDTLQERFQQLQMVFTEESLATNKELRDALQSACLVIGMHSDSATEAIVDTSLRFNKPFCVVPCCVFPNFFQRRFLHGNVPVRSYEQFCQYLLEKDSRFRQTTLPFDGRNIAIWWDGK